MAGSGAGSRIDAVAAGFLGGIESGVRAGDERFERGPFEDGPDGRDAGGDRDAERDPRRPEGRDGRPDALHRVEGGLRVRFHEEHDELLAAISARGVDAADGARDGARDGRQRGVSGEVPEAVVEAS